MKTPIILLLTSDPTLEETVAQTLLEMSGISHLTLSPDEALEIISAMGHDLALAVIDCEHGPYGIRLVSAIKDRREDFPMIVITGDNDKCIEALAYANGATACFSKPVSAAQIKSVLNQYRRSQHQLEPLVT
jgi:DNA-binding NtrC family response regulator